MYTRKQTDDLAFALVRGESQLLLTVRQGVDLGVAFLLDSAQARKRVDTINVHRA